MKFIVLTSAYYVWICTYCLVYSDSVYLDATYYLLEDLFGLILIYFVLKGIKPLSSIEVVAVYGLFFYKLLAMLSESLLYFNISIGFSWWTLFACSAFFTNTIAWVTLRKG